MVTDTWVDPARVERLREHWANGLTASQTAAEINREFRCDISRNSVISKIHRLGLAGRDGWASHENQKRSIIKKRQKRERDRRVKQRQLKTMQTNARRDALRALYLVPDPIGPVEEIEIPIHERKTLQQLEKDDCRWPIGDVGTPEFHFCNRKKVAGLPYCEHHSRRAFQPPNVRRGPFILESTADAVARRNAQREREKEAA